MLQQVVAVQVSAVRHGLAQPLLSFALVLPHGVQSVSEGHHGAPHEVQPRLVQVVGLDARLAAAPVWGRKALN